MSKPTRDDGLTAMGLPLDASDAAIKRRFEELALGTKNKGKGMHPDYGGTAEQMQQLTAAYRLARSQPVTKKQARRFVRRDSLVDVAEVVSEVAKVIDHPHAKTVQAFADLLLQNLRRKG